MDNKNIPSSAKDIFFMNQALKLAERSRGMTSPNPLVGAVLVKNGKVLAAAYHKRAGDPHAEALAILKAGTKAKDSTLYVTLEPCCHTGKKTPPCCPVILKAGIKKVVIAMRDPNPKVSGRGVKALRTQGVDVIEGVLEEKARKQNEVYSNFMTNGRPFVTLKCAMTLDGKIATPEGESKWITCEKSRTLVHKMRGSVDAVMTSVGTVLADNPRLTCRVKSAHKPARIIIDPELDTPLDFNVASTPPRTIFVTSIQDDRKKVLLKERGAEFVEFEGPKINLSRLMRELGGMDITSVMIEAGSSFSASALMAGIVDKVVFFIAPKIIGGYRSIPAIGGESFLKLADAIRISDMTVKKIGEDIMLTGYIKASGLD
jgi:diaminohydroxyphosphoribosylaminopyrimidine deaminase / 5-amino-6-(5-phosphoribosylamino)uracil reductase